MDFSLSEEQEAVRDLATTIFEGRATVDRVKAVEASAERVDRELWAELARANLLGIALPDDVGGSGLGVIELCLLLEQQGRRAAPVPLWPALVAAVTIAEHGTAAQRTRWLPGVVAGDTILTVALAEGGVNDPLEPALVATPDGDGWRLDGWKPSVPAAGVAAAALVGARLADGSTGVFLADPAGEGVHAEQVETTNRELHAHLTFSGAPAERVGGDRVLSWLFERTLVALSALQVGVCEAALALAAEYTSGRHQFGKPLSTFQGVALKAADAYIDTEAIRVTLWQAAWRLAEGLDATDAVLVAKWWASEGGQRVVHITQHLHGGIGADVDYPVHRYFLWGKQIETTLGGASAQLDRLGHHLAEATT